MNTPTLPVLTGTAVTLRPITDADTDLIVKWRNTPSVVQNFIFRQTFTPEMHRSWLATKVATGQVVQYIILDKADGKPVGSVYYRDIDNHNRSAEYGIFIGEESARGKGLGTETARLFTDFGFAGCICTASACACWPKNTAARRSYEKGRLCAGGYLPRYGAAGRSLPRRRLYGQAGGELTRKPMQKNPNLPAKKTPNALLCALGGSRVPCGLLLFVLPHAAERDLAAHHDEQRRGAL